MAPPHRINSFSQPASQLRAWQRRLLCGSVWAGDTVSEGPIQAFTACEIGLTEHQSVVSRQGHEERSATHHEGAVMARQRRING